MTTVVDLPELATHEAESSTHQWQVCKTSNGEIFALKWRDVLFYDAAH